MKLPQIIQCPRCEHAEFTGAGLKSFKIAAPYADIKNKKRVHITCYKCGEVFSIEEKFNFFQRLFGKYYLGAILLAGLIFWIIYLIF
jgi:predicted nucleic-acid-binding Zn-ribbon protein